VFAHPNPSPDPSAHALELPDTLIDFAADTTRAIAQPHYSSTFARTPDVKNIFAHAGRTVPYLAGRFGMIEQVRVIPGAEGRATAAETFRRLYWDTAACWATRAAHDARGRGNRPRRIRHQRRDLAVSCRDHIEATPELTDGERTAVLGATGTTLIPRLATLRPRTRTRAL
jgi:hypothetical protein